MKFKDILAFIWEWRFVIMAIISAIIYAFKDWQKAKAELYNAMLQAKRLAKDGILKTGVQQEEWVVNYSLQKLPVAWVRFLGEDNTRKLIRWLYHKGGDVLDNGKFDNSWPPESDQE